MKLGQRIEMGAWAAFRRGFLRIAAFLVAGGLLVSSAWGDEAAVKQRLQTVIADKGEVQFVGKTAIPGLYEVAVSGEVFYVDEQLQYIFSGDLMEAKTRRNLTELRRQALRPAAPIQLPLELAIRRVNGDGSRKLVTFEDPTCHFCQDLHKELARLPNATIYTFIYPFLSVMAYEKAKAIWCSADRPAAWEKWMREGVVDEVPPCNIKDLEKIVTLGKSLGISEVPTLLLADGQRIQGFIKVEDLEKRFAKSR